MAADSVEKNSPGKYFFYFSVGTTIPLMMIPWQNTKIRNVGIAPITSEA
jgi:hypothetical protein